MLDELCMSVAIFGLPRVPDGLAYRRSGRGGVCEFVRSSVVIGSFCSIAIAITSIGSRGSSTSNSRVVFVDTSRRLNSFDCRPRLGRARYMISDIRFDRYIYIYIYISHVKYL